MTDRQTDRRTDGQKAMHMSPPCNMHRWAQKGIGALNDDKIQLQKENAILFSTQDTLQLEKDNLQQKMMSLSFRNTNLQDEADHLQRENKLIKTTNNELQEQIVNRTHSLWKVRNELKEEKVKHGNEMQVMLRNQDIAKSSPQFRQLLLQLEYIAQLWKGNLKQKFRKFVAKVKPAKLSKFSKATK